MTTTQKSKMDVNEYNTKQEQLNKAYASAERTKSGLHTRKEMAEKSLMSLKNEKVQTDQQKNIGSGSDNSEQMKKLKERIEQLSNEIKEISKEEEKCYETELLLYQQQQQLSGVRERAGNSKQLTVIEPGLLEAPQKHHKSKLMHGSQHGIQEQHGVHGTHGVHGAHGLKSDIQEQHGIQGSETGFQEKRRVQGLQVGTQEQSEAHGLKSGMEEQRGVGVHAQVGFQEQHGSQGFQGSQVGVEKQSGVQGAQPAVMEQRGSHGLKSDMMHEPQAGFQEKRGIEAQYGMHGSQNEMNEHRGVHESCDHCDRFRESQKQNRQWDERSGAQSAMSSTFTSKDWNQPLSDPRGTVIGDKMYDQKRAQEDAASLRNAMKGWLGFGNDKGVIAQITGSRTFEQRQMIIKEYRCVDGKDKDERSLVNDLKSVLSGDLQKLVLPLYMQHGEYDANLMKNAMDGISYDTEVVIEVLCTEQINKLQK